MVAQEGEFQAVVLEDLLLQAVQKQAAPHAAQFWNLLVGLENIIFKFFDEIHHGLKIIIEIAGNENDGVGQAHQDPVELCIKNLWGVLHQK